MKLFYFLVISRGDVECEGVDFQTIVKAFVIDGKILYFISFIFTTNNLFLFQEEKATKESN